MMQFLPEDGLYVYFRYNEQQTVMVVLNTSKAEKTVSFKKYAERTDGFSRYKNVLTGTTAAMDDFKLGSYQSVVLELGK